MRRTILPLSLPLLLAACAFHSTATRWNGRVGPNGRPVFYVSTTKVGTNLLIAVPFLGRIGIDGQVDTLTRGLEERGGDRVRIVQGATENYWYGFPPLTWVFTPVVTTITAEFEPSVELVREVLTEQLRDEHEDLSDYALERRIDAEMRRYYPNLPRAALDPARPVVPRPTRVEDDAGGDGTSAEDPASELPPQPEPGQPGNAGDEPAGP